MFKENGVKTEKELTTDKTSKNYLMWTQKTRKFCILWPHRILELLIALLAFHKTPSCPVPQRLLHRATSLEKEREDYHGGLRWDSLLNTGFTLTSYELRLSSLTSPFFSLLFCKMDSRNKSCELEQCLVNSKHSINIRCCILFYLTQLIFS